MGASTVGGGPSDSNHDINGCVVNNDPNDPLVYYANIANNPQQHLNNKPIRHQFSIAPLSTVNSNDAKSINKPSSLHPGGISGTDFEMTNMTSNNLKQKLAGLHQPSATFPAPTYDIA